MKGAMKSGTARTNTVFNACLSAENVAMASGDHWKVSRLSRLVRGAAMEPKSLMKRC
jgi:hypothetical protein